MEETTLSQSVDTIEPKTCINCGQPSSGNSGSNPLCEECRQYFIKYPIPLWVKIFGGCVAALVIFSLFMMPVNLSSGIKYQRGINAENKKNYFTAEHLLESALKKDSFNTEALAHLLISSFYNDDLFTFSQTAAKLEKLRFEDEELLQQVDRLFSKANAYYPSDSFAILITKYSTIDSIPDEVLMNYSKANTEDLFSQVRYASVLYDKKQYAATDSILQQVLRKDDSYMPALEMLTSLKRVENKPEESLRYCDRLLSINHESVYGMASKARTLLKMKKKEEGLELAVKSANLDTANLYARASLVLAYHVNGNTKERDAIIKRQNLDKDPMSLVYFQYVLDIIANKETL